MMLCAAGFLGAWLYYREYWPWLQVEGEMERPLFSTEELRELSGINVNYAGGNYVLEKVNSKLSPEEQIALRAQGPAPRWFMLHPQQMPLDPAMIDHLLTGLADARVSNLANDEIDDSGLFPPELQLTVTVGKKRRAILFGKLNPVTKGRYVERDDRPGVGVVNDEVFAKLKVKASDLTLLTPLGFDLDRVERVSVYRPLQGRLIFVQSQTGSWELTDDEGQLGPLMDPQVVVQGVSTLLGTRIKSVVSDEMGQGAFSKIPLVSLDFQVHLWGTESQNFRATVHMAGEDKEGYLLSLEGSPFTYLIDRGWMRPAIVGLEKYLDKHPFAKRWQGELSGGGVEIDLVRGTCHESTKGGGRSENFVKLFKDLQVLTYLREEPEYESVGKFVVELRDQEVQTSIELIGRMLVDALPTGHSQAGPAPYLIRFKPPLGEVDKGILSDEDFSQLSELVESALSCRATPHTH